MTLETRPSQPIALLEELNRQSWLPFSEAYTRGDPEPYLSADLIRVEGNRRCLMDGLSEQGAVRLSVGVGLMAQALTPHLLSQQPRATELANSVARRECIMVASVRAMRVPSVSMARWLLSLYLSDALRASPG